MKELAYSHQELFRVMGNALGMVLSEEYPPQKPNGAEQACAIPEKALMPLTEGLQILIAEFIQSWIDSGSEREVTMENEELFSAIRNELKSWSTIWDKEEV